MGYANIVHRIENRLEHRRERVYSFLCSALDDDDQSRESDLRIRRLQSFYNEISFIQDSIHEIISEENIE